MKLYIATSWRNTLYQEVLKKTREMGFDVYDFKNPDTAFDWAEVFDLVSWRTLPTSVQFNGLKEAVPRRAYKADMEALKEADMLFLLLPAGRSAHFEAGIAHAMGKPVIIYADPEPKIELELVYLEHAPTTYLNDAYTLLEDYREILEMANEYAEKSAPNTRQRAAVPDEEG